MTGESNKNKVDKTIQIRIKLKGKNQVNSILLIQ